MTESGHDFWVGEVDDNVVKLYASYNLARPAADVLYERLAQVEKWGDQSHLDGTGAGYYKDMADKYRAIADQLASEPNEKWSFIMLEEVYEALAEGPETEELYTELKQASAVIQGWMEDLRKRLDGNS